MHDWSSTITYPPFAIALLAGLLGGFVRGYSGFGFALAALPILTLALPPSTAVPAVLPPEVAIALFSIPSLSRNIAWSVLGRLILGTLIGTPIGLVLLAAAPATTMRLIVSFVIGIAVLVLWYRPVLSQKMIGFARLVAAGLTSGLLNGSTALSGPPVIVALLGTGLPTAVTRVTIMAFVACSAALGLVMASVGGLYTLPTAAATFVLAPGALLGGLAGSAVFVRTDEAHYHRASLIILLTVASISVASAGWTLFCPMS
jgi:uncharacterized membrane protein YfcA